MIFASSAYVSLLFCWPPAKKKGAALSCRMFEASPSHWRRPLVAARLDARQACRTAWRSGSPAMTRRFSARCPRSWTACARRGDSPHAARGGGGAGGLWREGPTAIGARPLSPFVGWVTGSPTQIDYRKEVEYSYSNLSTGGPSWGFAQVMS